MDKEELSARLEEKRIQKLALEETLSNLEKHFDDGKISEEFYYKRRTSLSASIKTLEKEIQEFKKQSEKLPPAIQTSEMRKRGSERDVDRSVRIGKGAVISGDVVTGTKVTREGGITIKGKEIEIHGDIAGRDIIKGAEVFGKPDTDKDKDFLQNKLNIHLQNLRNLELQKAKYGSLNVPVHILTQIDEEEKEIAEIRRKFNLSPKPFKSEKLIRKVRDALTMSRTVQTSLDETTQGFEDAKKEFEFMRLAIEEAKESKQEKNKTSLYVGAVAVKDGNVLAKAHRGEISEGEHAEYTILERKLQDKDLSGATIYTTLEPCTKRNHPKSPCAKRITQRRIGRVVIGIVDPNPDICGKGIWILTENNIIVEHFPHELQEEIRRINHMFISEQLNESKRKPEMLEEELKIARQKLTELEERFNKKETSFPGAEVKIKIGDVRNSNLTIARRDIREKPISQEPISQDKVDIEIGKVEGSSLKIAGRDYLDRIEISNKRAEVKAIESELLGLKKGITCKDAWSSLKSDLTDDELVNEGRDIIKNKAIRIFYMPIVNFGRSKREIIGYELLARGPKDSPLEKRPDKIFEIAGKIDKLPELDLLCLINALEASKKIPSGIRPFINILPLTLLKEGFYDLLKSCERNDIVFEIKEELIPLQVSQEIKDRVNALKAKGYEIAADDQGVGGATDQRLIEFKPHYIKVDQYFMRSIWKDQRESAKKCLSHYCELSNVWNGKVLVEGITENHDQKDLNQLLELGISLGQGYLFGEPKEEIRNEQD